MITVEGHLDCIPKPQTIQCCHIPCRLMYIVKKHAHHIITILNTTYKTTLSTWVCIFFFMLCSRI